MLDLEPGVSHDIALTATDTSDPASRGTSINVDSFVTLSRAPEVVS